MNIATGRIPDEDHGRRNVLWLGSSPPAMLAAHLEATTPRHVLVPITQEQFTDEAPFARALLISYDGEDPDHLNASVFAAVIDQAALHGLFVGIVQRVPSEAPLRMPSVAAQRRFADLCETLNLEHVRYEHLPGFNWTICAEVILRHCPGRGDRPEMRLEGDVPGDAEQCMLLRRAFNELAGVSLRMLEGGRSSAGVWQVTPEDPSQPFLTLPLVVKAQVLEKMQRERSNCILLKGLVPPRLYADLHVDRCVEGVTMGVVVYDLVSRADSFRNALSGAERPGVLVESLYQHTLHGPHSAGRTPKFAQLAAELSSPRLSVIRWNDDLACSAQQACSQTPSVRDMSQLRTAMEALPAIPYYTATVHGDLHEGNLFVPEGTHDVMIIDYGSVLTDAPIVMDFACLEVSLVMWSYDRTNSINSSIDVETPSNCEGLVPWLHRAFTLPSRGFPKRNCPLPWLAQAVCAIRVALGACEPDQLSYAIALAGYLLRFASYPDGRAMQTRVLAYSLADNLVCGIEDELLRRAGIVHRRARIVLRT